MKFKNIVCFLLILILGLAVNLESIAQKRSGSVGKKNQERLIPYRIADKWGFSDTAGTILIQPQYDDIEIMEYGFFKVKMGDKYGVVNKQGKVIVPPESVEVYDFGDYMQKGLPLAGLKNSTNYEGRWGYLDSLENIIQPPKNGIVRPIDFQTFLVSRTPNRWERNTKYGEIFTKYGVLKKGKMIIPTKYREIRVRPNGFIAALNYRNKWGLWDSRGKRIVKPNYDMISNFSSGMAVVGRNNYTIVVSEHRTNQYGHSRYLNKYINDWTYQFIPKKGRKKIKTLFKDVVLDHDQKPFSEGLTAVSINGKDYGFIDSTGRAVIDYKYQYTSPFQNGVAIVKLKDKYGIINMKDNVVVPFMYDSLSWRWSGYIMGIITAIINKGEREVYGYVKSEEKQSAIIYSSLEFFSNNRAKFERDSITGYIDGNGNEVISFPKGYYLNGFYNGLALICTKEKCGYIDTSGTIIIPINYEGWGSEYFYRFKGGAAIVKKDGKGGFINRSGKEISPFIEPKLINGWRKEFNIYNNFQDGYGSVLKKREFNSDEEAYISLFMVIDTAGRRISDLEFTKVTRFTSGLAMGCLNTGCGIINKDGKVIIPFNYQFELKQVRDKDLRAYRNDTYPTPLHGDLFRVLDPNDPEQKRVLGFMNLKGKKYWRD